MNKNKHNKKSAFTLAEAVIALAIIAVVVSASIPLVTVKLRHDLAERKEGTVWGVSPISTGHGLLTDSAVVITNSNGTTNNIDNAGTNNYLTSFDVDNGILGNPRKHYPASLSYWVNPPSSLLSSIYSDRPMFKVGDYNFAQIKNNIFITTSDIPNTIDAKYGSSINATTCFNTDNCKGNIILGGKNCQGAAPCDATNGTNFLNSANHFVNTTIIGSGNYNIGNGIDYGLIAGFNNGTNNASYLTIVGAGNNAINDYDVIVGNKITPDHNQLISIGAGTAGGANGASYYPLISFSYTNVTGASPNQHVTFNKPTIIDGEITADTITLASDKRLKNVLEDYDKGLNEILKVNPVDFSFKSDKTNTLQTGVIAQDLQKIFPEAVVTMPNDYLGVDISPVFFAALNAIKELDRKTQLEKERTQRLKVEYLALVAGEEYKESLYDKVVKFFKKVKKKLKLN